MEREDGAKIAIFIFGEVGWNLPVQGRVGVACTAAYDACILFCFG